MKTAIMQPYFLPYIGYWQLMNAVDIFIILDDVNFISRGYINRNTILLNNKEFRFSIPLKKASQNKLIKDTYLNFSLSEREKLLKTCNLAYCKAPYFKDVYPLFESMVMYPEDNLAKYIEFSFYQLTSYFDIKTKFMISSKIQKDESLKSQEKIVELCRQVNTTVYINLPGGRKLYNKEDFKKNNMDLKFIQPKKISYQQFSIESFLPNLSFLDVLMFNNRDQVKNILGEYCLE